MRKAFYILIPLILIFVGLSIRQYIFLNINQKQETSDFIYKQIILCGKNIEESCMNFEESVKFEFANRELPHFFDPQPEKLDFSVRLNYVDGEIKRIRRFYSRNQELISRVIIYNTEYYRTFDRNRDNYFQVSPSKRFSTPQLLQPLAVTSDTGQVLSYIQPISNTAGVVVANIRFEFNIPEFISSHFDQFYIGKNSWYWAINESGEIIFHKYSETSQHSDFRSDQTAKFLTNLQNKLTFNIQHKLTTDRSYNAYSVFYPINLFGKSTGIVFSVNTDTLWKFQNETNISILIFFLVVITSIIILFSVIIKNMIGNRKRLETTDTLLRSANYASEVLLTEPEFSQAIRQFLEITARTFGFHRGYLYQVDESAHGDQFQLSNEWYDPSFLKSLAEMGKTGSRPVSQSSFSVIVASLRKKEIIKLNDDEYEGPFGETLKALGFKAILLLPIFLDDRLITIAGFADCLHHRSWRGYENAVFTNIMHALEGAIAIRNNQVELIKAKDAAEKANRLKSQFLANVSHEIRTPMNAILGFSEVMLNTTQDTKQKHNLKTILESGRMLLSLINDILDLSKIEAGRIELSPGPADLRIIVEDLHQLFRQKLEEKNLQFFTEIDDQFPRTILIDEVRLRQILLNLIGNAVKFTNKGYVLFKAEINNKNEETISFELSVIDTGIGISEDDYERIFESFSQQSGQDNRKYGGTGLGLAISKRLCELMNGTIGLESKPDMGSRFFLNFGQVEYSQDAIEQVGSYYWLDDNLRFRGATVLVVDDIEYNRQLVFTYLDNHNLRIVQATSGAEAVSQAMEINPDLILMDIRMPGMNGYEATERIRDYDALNDIPVIALTASTNQREIDYRPNLFSGYLRKPVQKNQLINELMRFLPYDMNESPEDGSAKARGEQVHPLGDAIMPAELRPLFLGIFQAEIQRQAGMIIPDELVLLSGRMAEFGQQHGLELLIQWCRLLDDAVENFDFEEIQRLLQRVHTLTS